MPFVDERSYEFRLAAHWRAGARRGLELRGDRLVVPDQLAVQPLPGSGTADAEALPAVDWCGHLVWLRPTSRELVRRLPQDRLVTELGHLDGPVPARRLVAGRTVLWVLAGGSLHRYGAATVQRLTPARPRIGWRLCDAVGDVADGLWVTESDSSGRWRLRHVDCWGRTCRDTITVDGPDGDELTVVRVEGSQLAVVDPAGSTALFVADPAAGTVRRLPIDPVHRRGRTLIAAGPGERVHLLTALDNMGADGVRAVYQAVDLRAGDVEHHQVLQVPRALGRPTTLVGAAPNPVLACSRGLAEIAPTRAAREAYQATFITPGLVSPVGPRAGWNRAEVDVVLPPGTTMEVTWAATDEAWLVDRAAQLVKGRSTPSLVDELEELLPWHQEAVTYRGAGDAEERLAALLDGVEETTLWLRIRFHMPAGGPAPSLVGLRVRYPDISYIDHLPAIYRENPRAAPELRQILGPFEVLLGGIDETLRLLPDRLDPSTADDDWTDYLLGWLGFPPLGELPAPVRRHLLEDAAELLDLRGTREGVERLLSLVTEDRASVTDSSEEAVGWFLGREDVASIGAQAGRLGVDTVVLQQLPRPARAGGMVLGDARLGHACGDPQTMLGRRARTVTVTLDVGTADQTALEPVVERLLDAFVPAHCRVRLLWTGESRDRSPRLDVDLRLLPKAPGADGEVHPESRLHGDATWRLGATTRLGSWALPEAALHAAVLDHRARLDTGPRLQ